MNADFTYAIQNLNSGSGDFSVYGIDWSGMPTPKYIVTKSNSAIWRDNSKQNTWTLNAYANYAKTFAKSHNLNVMVELMLKKWIILIYMDTARDCMMKHIPN